MASRNLPGDSRAYQIQTPCIVFFVLTPFFVAIRIWARVKIRGRRGLGWDDWSIVTAAIFALIVSGLQMGSCAYGFGQHIKNLAKPNKLITLKLFYVAQAFYKLAINLTKTSILLLYLRIFPFRWFQLTCHVLITLILLYMVGTTASSIWQCTPIPRAWDKSIPGTCISITANWYANAGFSIATDVIILALPMYPIYASQLPTSQKFAVMVVFALGLFTTITSILRMQTLSFSSLSPDITYDIDSTIWTMIEVHLAIICACLPVCRLPLAYILPAYFSSPSSSSSSSAFPCSGSNPYSISSSSYYSASYPRKSKKVIITDPSHSPSGSTRELAELPSRASAATSSPGGGGGGGDGGASSTRTQSTRGQDDDNNYYENVPVMHPGVQVFFTPSRGDDGRNLNGEKRKGAEEFVQVSSPRNSLRRPLPPPRTSSLIRIRQEHRRTGSSGVLGDGYFGRLDANGGAVGGRGQGNS